MVYFLKELMYSHSIYINDDTASDDGKTEGADSRWGRRTASQTGDPQNFTSGTDGREEVFDAARPGSDWRDGIRFSTAMARE